MPRRPSPVHSTSFSSAADFGGGIMRTAVLVIVLGALAQAVFAIGGDIPETTTRPPARKLSLADQPFSTFRQIDALLTRLDHDTLILRSRTRAATKLRNRNKRAHALRAAQQ